MAYIYHFPVLTVYVDQMYSNKMANNGFATTTFNIQRGTVNNIIKISCVETKDSPSLAEPSNIAAMIVDTNKTRFTTNRNDVVPKVKNPAVTMAVSSIPILRKEAMMKNRILKN